jgi:hypothetical protein
LSCCWRSTPNNKTECALFSCNTLLKGSSLTPFLNIHGQWKVNNGEMQCTKGQRLEAYLE